jgi:hypothetical protein
VQRREIEAYVQANVDAVRDVCARALPDVALANHLVMGPGDPRPRAGGPGALRREGPRQRPGVRRQARPAALPAVGARGPGDARTVLVGSRHTGESLWAAMQDDDLPERTRLGPPGVDVAEFRPRDGRRRGIASLDRAPGRERGRRAARAPSRATPAPPLTPCAARLHRDRHVCFIGKLIVSKGSTCSWRRGRSCPRHGS